MQGFSEQRRRFGRYPFGMSDPNPHDGPSYEEIELEDGTTYKRPIFLGWWSRDETRDRDLQAARKRAGVKQTGPFADED